ncbi:hypothetical protein MNBD_GAMMA20-1125, partial [hydrothermal vent metagenome]
MAWVRPDVIPASGLKSILSKDENFEFHINTSGNIYWWWHDSGGTSHTLTSSGATLSPGNWYHITIVYAASGTQKIYIDGVERANGTRTESLRTNADPLQIGADQGFSGREFDGLIDEARVYDSALSAAQVAVAMNETRPCAGTLDHFVISHDGSGINCLAETITVTVAAADGSTVSTYTGSISLDTQTTTGSWGLNAGGGSFVDAVAGDGLASYTFAAADAGVAIFNLDYRSGPASIDIDVFDGVIRDDDTEGSLVFSPSGFVVTAAPLSNPPPVLIDTGIVAQTAASDFPLYITAYGQTPTDPVCGIIEAYDGVKNIKFWSSYNDPLTGTLPVSINSNAIADNEAVSATQAVAFVQGQAAITVNYADVGDIDVAMKDDSTGNPSLPAGIGGASQPFVVRPAGFVLSNILRSNDSAANPAATDENGAVFIAAGNPFSVTVTAVNSLGNATPNYGQEASPESVLLTPSLVAAGGANNPPLS